MDFDYFYKHKNEIKILELHVSNLPLWVDESLLADLFSRWASIKNVTIIKLHYKETLSALVGFWDFDQMIAALKNSYRCKIGGRLIYVDFSKEAVICCNFCFKFGHMMESCWQLKQRQQRERLKVRQNSRGEISRVNSHSFIKTINLNYERNQSPHQNRSQSPYKKCSSKPYEEKNEKKTFYSPYKRSNFKKAQSNRYVKPYEEDSLPETTYDEEVGEKKNWNRKSKALNRGKESEKELEFVEIIGSKEDSEGWISHEDELKLERLEKEGFFRGKCKLNHPFVRIIRSDRKDDKIDY